MGGDRLPRVDVPPPAPDRFDITSLGEVMLRFDPGELRIHAARSFTVWEGGGEYNVARGLSSCFQLRAAHIAALVDNPLGRLIEARMREGGVDVSGLRFVAFDGVGRAARNALNFTERGVGVRAALGVSDRGHSPTAQLTVGDVDFDACFTRWRPRCFHTGGIFAGLSQHAPAVAEQAMRWARRHGAWVSFDRNYRASLWLDRGGRASARATTDALLPQVDVLFGLDVEEAATAGIDRLDPDLPERDPTRLRAALDAVLARFPNLRAIASTLRRIDSASRHHLRGVALVEGRLVASRTYATEVVDRVGSGDAFAAGFLYGLLAGDDPQTAIEWAAAHGALVMTTPGDTSLATREEVLRLMDGADAAVRR